MLTQKHDPRNHKTDTKKKSAQRKVRVTMKWKSLIWRPHSQNQQLLGIKIYLGEFQDGGQRVGRDTLYLLSRIDLH